MISMNGCVRQILVLFLLLLLVNCASHATLEGLTPEARQYIARAKQQPLNFNVAAKYDYYVWGRAQGFVAEYCPMKIQLVSDFVIDTYNPPKDKLGYRIVKTPLRDSLQMAVHCIPGSELLGDVASTHGHLCSYYMLTGKTPPMNDIALTIKEINVEGWKIILGASLAAGLTYFIIYASTYD